MKKLVFAALAIGAMAACTKSAVQYEQTGEICLQPVAQKATKAAVDGEVYPTTESFNVWANWYSPNSKLGNTYTGNGELYINEGKFTGRTLEGGSTVWGGANPKYYWPTTGALAFAGYSPASVKPEPFQEGDPVFGYEFSEKLFTVTNYRQSNNVNETKDLMWFDFEDGEFYENSGTNTDGSVPVLFKHALSWLTFKFNLSEATTPRNWIVTDVQLNGLKTKGDFNSKHETSGTPVWSNVVTESGKNSMIVYSGGVATTNDNKGYIAYSQNNPVTLENEDNGVLVIPQSCIIENVQLVVNYQLAKQGTEGYLPQTVTLDLSGAESGNEWLPGKHYIYTIIFGANEILISPSVTDWIDKEVDIDVQ